MKRLCLLLIVLLLLLAPAAAQDALNLPAPLFILTNEGRIQRIGLGAEGISSVLTNDAFVLDFGVSPDGNWIAYRTEDALSLAGVFTASEHTLDAANAGLPPLRGRGDTIAWSPAGDAIAVTTEDGGRVYFATDAAQAAGGAIYTTQTLTEGVFVRFIWGPGGVYLAGEAEDNVWWVYRRDGAAMTLVSALPSSLGVAWINPGEFVFAPAEGGLIALDLNRGGDQTILLDDTWNYADPQLLRDGTLAVFGRQKGDTSLAPGYSLLLGLSPGAPEVNYLSEVALDPTTVDWAPGGDLLVAFEGGAFVLVDPASGQGFPLPIAGAVTYTWGAPPLERVSGLSLPVAGFFLADDVTGVPQVWQLPADGSPAAPITVDADGVDSFGVTANGTRVVYSSGRRVMVQTVGEAQAVDIAQRTSDDAPAYPVFDRTGERVVYVDGGLWSVGLDGSAPVEILPADDRRLRPLAFAPTLDALLTLSQNAASGSVLVDPNAAAVFVLEEQRPGAAWLSDSRIATFGFAGGDSLGGLLIRDPNAPDQFTELLPPIISVESVAEVAPGRIRLALPQYYFGTTVGPVRLAVVETDVVNGQLALVQNGGFLRAPQLAPGGRFAAGYTYTTADNPPRGPLTLRDLDSGRQVVLTEPALVWDFVWTQR